MSDNKFAFQCKSCGAVEPAGHAGDNAVPGACHVCRHGVRYEVHSDGTGFRVIREPQNWTVLSDLKPDELAKDFARHGLTPDRVTRHEPKVVTPPDGKTVIATAEESPRSKDKATAQ